MTSDARNTIPSHKALSDAEKSALFHEGIRQFNSKQFFLCHETLEELWMHEPGSIRIFYQGIIQLATSYYHLVRHNYTGAANLSEAAIQKLRSFEPETLGIDVSLLLENAEISRAHLIELGEEMIETFDVHFIPLIETRSR